MRDRAHGPASRWPPALLVAFLLLFALWAGGRYRCQVASDPSTYLRFAETLSRGAWHVDYPPDRLFAEYYGPAEIYRATYTHLVMHGAAVLFVAVGYPLFLATLTNVGGPYAPFFANTIVFLAFFPLLYFFTAAVFREERWRREAGLFAVLLYFVVLRERIEVLIGPFRDPLSYTLLLAALLLFLRFLDGRRRAAPLALAGLLFGLAAAVRETTVLAAVPLLVLYLARARRDGAGPLLRRLAVFAASALLGVAPMLVQNHRASGNPFYPSHLLLSQVKRGIVQEAGDAPTYSMSGLKARNFPGTSRRHLAGLRETYGPLMAGLFLAGLWRGRRSRALAGLLLPFVAVYFLFYSFYYTSPWRYLFVVHLALVPVAALGLAALLRWLEGRVRLPLVLLAAAALLGAVAWQGRTAPGERFTRADAERFRADFEAVVPDGAVVFAEKPMRRVVDYFTHAYGIRADDVERPERGITLEKAVGFYLARHPGVFFLDSRDLDARHLYRRTPVVREKLLASFDLEPAWEMEAARYHLRDAVGRERAKLYRVVPWREGATSFETPAAGGGDGILRLDLRRIGAVARGRLMLTVGGHDVTGPLGDGVNFIGIPGGWRSDGPLRGVLDADGPLPRSVAARFYRLEEPVTVEIGPDAVPLDESLLSAGFFTLPAGKSARNLDGEGRVKLPLVPEAGTTLFVEVRHVLTGGEGKGEAVFSVEGVEQARVPLAAGDGWRSAGFPVAGIAGGAAAKLTVVAALGNSPPGDLVYGIDRFTVRRFDHRVPLGRIDAGEGDGLFVRSGLYDPQRHRETATVRWSDGAARLNLPLPEALAGKPLRISLGVWGPPAASGVTTCRLSLNGAPAAERPLRPGDFQVIDYDTPAEASPGRLNVLAVDTPAWRPSARLGTPDDRRLGLMLQWVEVAQKE